MEKKTVLIISCLLFFIGCAYIKPHPRPWTKKEGVAAGFFIVAHALNAYSTERHQDNPIYYDYKRRAIIECYEGNPILGEHPTDNQIVAYFSITGIGALVIAYLYPELIYPLLGGYGAVNSYWAYRDLKDIKEHR